MANRIYYYHWSTGNYTTGFVIGFTSLKEGRKHAKENYPKDQDIEVKRLKEGEILDIYTGE